MGKTHEIKGLMVGIVFEKSISVGTRQLSHIPNRYYLYSRRLMVIQVVSTSEFHEY